MAGFAAAGIVVAGGLVAAAPAHADPGDAVAEAASAALSLEILGFEADVLATTGLLSVSYPGADSYQLADVTLVGDDIANISLGVADASASSDAAGSTGSATVADASLNLFGIDVVTVDAATAQATCTIGETPQAVADVAGLTVFGDAATVDAGAPVVVAESDLLGEVAGVDLTGLRITVSVSQVETVLDDTAVAIALVAELGVQGTLLGVPFVEALGAVTLATAGCQTPVAVPVTATAIDPAVGPTSGGQTVTITGTGFTPQTSVTFDGVAATGVTASEDGSEVTAITPAHAAGPVTVAVSNPGGNVAELGYTYVAPAASLAPSTGPEEGGTVVTISGAGLNPTTAVTFGGVPADITSVSPDGTEVVVTAPAGTGTVPVVLTIANGAELPAGAFTYVAPAVAGLDPDAGPIAGGQTVTIIGTGLAETTGVLFDGVPGTISGTPADGQVVVVTPPGTAGIVDVTIELPGDDLVVEDGYLYVGVPVVASVTPDQGPAAGGTTVVVEGGGFVPGATTITICGVTIPGADVVVNPEGTRLQFTTPACDAGPATIVVTTPGGSIGDLASATSRLPPAGAGAAAGAWPARAARLVDRCWQHLCSS